ncbi:MAG: tRNA-dihydrouridine synthase family protein [Kiritimatiellae bacterium]|nr:tRNA-dihydrouridine synthase family protein [Kiritimatiellia bacterium]
MRTRLIIGGTELPTPVLLAPMAGYTDLPYRLCIRRLGGVGLAFTELLNPQSLVRGGGRKRAALIATCPEDAPLAWQLYGNEPDRMAQAAQWLEAHGAPFVDINMGCPQKKITGKGRGAALLRTPELAVEILRRVRQAVRIPVSAKLRLGWEAGERVAPALARALEQAGAAALTVHARTRAQGYRGRADWTGIREVVEAVSRIPVIGNGDIDSAASARRMFGETGCAAVMIGRGVVRHPWLIRDIWRDLEGLEPLPEPTPADWAAFSQSHFDGMLQLYGPRTAVLLFRRWLAPYAKGLGLAREALISLYTIADPAELAGAIGWA